MGGRAPRKRGPPNCAFTSWYPIRCECAAGFSWQGAVSWCMRINWDRLPRLIAPLTVAASIAAFLVIELELARAWAVLSYSRGPPTGTGSGLGRWFETPGCLPGLRRDRRGDSNAADRAPGVQALGRQLSGHRLCASLHTARDRLHAGRVRKDPRRHRWRGRSQPEASLAQTAAAPHPSSCPMLCRWRRFHI